MRKADVKRIISAKLTADAPLYKLCAVGDEKIRAAARQGGERRVLFLRDIPCQCGKDDAVLCFIGAKNIAQYLLGIILVAEGWIRRRALAQGAISLEVHEVCRPFGVRDVQKQIGNLLGREYERGVSSLGVLGARLRNEPLFFKECYDLLSPTIDYKELPEQNKFRLKEITDELRVEAGFRLAYTMNQIFK